MPPTPRPSSPPTTSTRSRSAAGSTLFGNIAHVWSAYEARDRSTGAEPERRGINSIQLFQAIAELGWRIIAMIWDNEREGVRIEGFEPTA